MATERVQKILAQAGIASRRKAEEMITEGLVTINGKLAKLGDKADLQADAIKVKGKLLKTKEPLVYLAFYKPKGVISMLADPEGRATLKDFIGKVDARVYPIGRLDFNSEGLILLTNDGAFAEKMQKMEGIPRVYHIKVRGRPDTSMVAKLEKGARIGNRLIKPHSVRMAEELANKIRIEVVFTDSGAIDVKALFETRGFLVESIRRTAIGQITLRGLLPGHFRYLKPSQVEAILTHPELGLRNISDEGSPSYEGGFEYRNPLGRRDAEREPDRSGVKGKIVVRPVEPQSAGEKTTVRPRASAGRPSPVKPLSKPVGPRGFGSADRERTPSRGGFGARGRSQDRDEKPRPTSRIRVTRRPGRD